MWVSIHCYHQTRVMFCCRGNGNVLTDLNGRIIVDDGDYLVFYSLQSDTEPDDRQFDMFTWNHTMGEVNIISQNSQSNLGKGMLSGLISFQLCWHGIRPDLVNCQRNLFYMTITLINISREKAHTSDRNPQLLLVWVLQRAPNVGDVKYLYIEIAFVVYLTSLSFYSCFNLSQLRFGILAT